MFVYANKCRKAYYRGIWLRTKEPELLVYLFKIREQQLLMYLIQIMKPFRFFIYNLTFLSWNFLRCIVKFMKTLSSTVLIMAVPSFSIVTKRNKKCVLHISKQLFSSFRNVYVSVNCLLWNSQNYWNWNWKNLNHVIRIIGKGGHTYFFFHA